jgi:hypothetical protein
MSRIGVVLLLLMSASAGCRRSPRRPHDDPGPFDATSCTRWHVPPADGSGVTRVWVAETSECYLSGAVDMFGLPDGIRLRIVETLAHEGKTIAPADRVVSFLFEGVTAPKLQTCAAFRAEAGKLVIEPKSDRIQGSGDGIATSAMVHLTTGEMRAIARTRNPVFTVCGYDPVTPAPRALALFQRFVEEM